MIQLVLEKDENGAMVPLAPLNEPVVQILRLGPERTVALHIDPLHPPAIDEVIDVGAAPGGGKGCRSRRSARGRARRRVTGRYRP